MHAMGVSRTFMIRRRGQRALEAGLSVSVSSPTGMRVIAGNGCVLATQRTYKPEYDLGQEMEHYAFQEVKEDFLEHMVEQALEN